MRTRGANDMNAQPPRVQLLLLLAVWLAAVAWSGGSIPLNVSTAAAAEGSRAELAEVVALYRQEGAEPALPEFEKLLEKYRAAGDVVGEAEASRWVGECHWRLGNLDDARPHLEHALNLTLAAGNRIAESRILNVLGLLEWDLGNYPAALGDFDQALAIAAAADDRRLSASTLNNRGLVKDELGDYQASLQDYESSLALFRTEGDLRGQGDALGNIGGVHLLLGRFQNALEHYRQALAISEQLESKPAMTIDHGNIALCLLGLGQAEAALAHFDRAMELARETGMDQEEAYWRRGKANALVGMGQYDLALEQYRLALAAHEQSGARSLLLAAQHDMGRLMLTLGDPVSAETWFQQAVRLAREIGQAQALTLNLMALGDLQLRRGRLEEARALYAQALQRAGEAGEASFEARSLLRLSHVDREQGLPDAAAENAGKALALAQAHQAQPLEAEAWYALGEAARLRADREQALEAYGRAEAAAGTPADPDLAWQIHYGRGRALEAAGELPGAVGALQSAVEIIESVRERLREERFRAGWVEDKYRVYIDLARLQLELGRTEDAFSTAERLRARSFLTQLERRPAAASGGDALRQAELRERIRQLQRVLTDEQERAAPDRRQAAIETFSTELLQAEREYQAFLDDLGGSAAAPGAVNLPGLAQLQSRLGAGDALLEYVAGERELMVFVVRRDRLRAVTYPVQLQDLTARVNLLRELIQQPGEEAWREPAAALSALLIGPLRQQGLLQGIGHVHVVPHGILNYLPFAVLPLDGGEDRVLIEAYTLSYLPAAAALVEATDVARPGRTLLAMAPEKARLRFAPREAESVAAMFQPNARLLLGRNATESAFKSQAGDFDVLHLATHGVFNHRNPLLSGLEFEADPLNDGLLEVHEILGLTLRAELVTMSACQTGLGSGWFTDVPAGDDFVGLTRAFLVAGSQSVLASLWEVDDRSTVELMQGFYRGTRGGATADGRAEALARVQRAMRSSEEFNHPFYWAPFVLVGQQGNATVRS